MTIHWVDPRTNTPPPYLGPERPLATDEAELEGLLKALREGRLYDAEAWVRDGRPLQVDPQSIQHRRRRPTALSVAIGAGQVDLVRLFLCNGYRTELEISSPLDEVLERRRWDMLDLLLNWGADPHGADVCRILDTYRTAIFERFRAAGVDVTAGDAMASTLAHSSSNRPLYGFARNLRESDPRVQRALDVGLGAAIRHKNDKAVSLCVWAGANPRRRVGDIGDDPADDAEGYTALELAVSRGAPGFLKKFGFDPEADDIEQLYGSVHNLDVLRALVAVRPPKNWHRITMRFLSSLALSRRWSIYMTGLWDVEQVFALGGRLGALEQHERREIRRLLLLLDERDAQRLFRRLSTPQGMERAAFLDLVAYPKLAARYATWSRHSGVDKALWIDLAALPGAPSAVRRQARERAHPPRRIVTETELEEAGVVRVLSREELYALVWSEPVWTLAKRFGLSDNGLRKRCKAMNVPTPPKGYWQKTRHGGRQRLPGLPPLHTGSRTRPTTGDAPLSPL